MIKPFLDTGLSRLYNLDCVQAMEELADSGEKVDKIITSPPYNIIRGGLSDRGYDIYNDGMRNDEYSSWITSIFKLYDRILRNDGCVLFNMSYGSENTECMPLTVARVLRETPFTLADILVWKKKSAFPNDMSPNKMTRICEFVFVFCRRSEFKTFTSNKKVMSTRSNGQKMYENVFNFFEAKNNDGQTKINMATFSTDFVESLIDRYVRSSDVVMDNFSGTGTTMVACEEHGIRGIYIEMSKAQCEYSAERVRSVKQRLF